MSISAKLRFRVLERDRFTCQYCGRTSQEVELHVDHVIPKSRGGPDAMENLKAACRDCNLGKGARPLDHVWRLTEGPHGAVGPRHGQSVTSPGDDTSWVPAVWVFAIPGDGIDSIVTQMESKAIMESPHAVYLRDGTPWLANYPAWARLTERCLPARPELLGVYLGVTENLVAHGELAWIPAGELIFYVAGIGPEVTPNYQLDATCDAEEAV